MSEKQRPDSGQPDSHRGRSSSRPMAGSQGAEKGRQWARSPEQRASRGLSGGSRKTLAGLVAGAVVVLVGAGILLSLTIFQARPPSTASSSQGTGSTRGSADAKVVVEEYSDFQCPFCARFALYTFPSIDRTYVATGKVRWVFRHFARIGPESVSAARAAECAGEQDKFWPYHDKLFNSQQGENKGSFSNDRLKNMARDLGLSEAFNSCFDSGRWSDKVDRDINEGLRKGVGGTPTFFIGQRKVVGAEAYSVFQAAIEEALRQQP